MDIFQKHQLDIARKTLKMPDVMVRVMGGMTKKEARVIIKRLTKQVQEKRKLHKKRGRKKHFNTWF